MTLPNSPAAGTIIRAMLSSFSITGTQVNFGSAGGSDLSQDAFSPNTNYGMGSPQNNTLFYNIVLIFNGSIWVNNNQAF
jgi:hypothetical protein